jgi:hypothetical protein
MHLSCVDVRGGGGWVSEKMFSREQYEQLRSFPEIRRDELFRFFTLTPTDAAFVDPGAGRGPGDRLGMAVQLATWAVAGAEPLPLFLQDQESRAATQRQSRSARRRELQDDAEVGVVGTGGEGDLVGGVDAEALDVGGQVRREDREVFGGDRPAPRRSGRG